MRPWRHLFPLSSDELLSHTRHLTIFPHSFSQCWKPSSFLIQSFLCHIPHLTSGYHILTASVWEAVSGALSYNDFSADRFHPVISLHSIFRLKSSPLIHGMFSAFQTVSPGLPTCTVEGCQRHRFRECECGGKCCDDGFCFT